jgi:putative Mg2+ transporter-C (MgtC) family protein
MDLFFGFHISSGTTGGMALSLLTAVVLGGLIGLEREMRGHPAGLRTHILVCLGSTLITLVSVQIATMGPQRGDPARLAAQIVTGIGFLGAGAIVREGATIRGLTTAASIWTTAAIGIALGVAPRFGELAVIATLIVIFTLTVLNWLEDLLEVKGRRLLSLEIHVQDRENTTARALTVITSHQVRVRSIKYEPRREPDIRPLFLRLQTRKGFDRDALLSDLAKESGIQYVHLE